MIGGRFPAKDLLPHWAAQVIGAILAAAVLYLIISGAPGFEGVGSFASNGYGEASPQGYSMMSALVTEIVLTAFLLIIILGATSEKAPPALPPSPSVWG